MEKPAGSLTVEGEAVVVPTKAYEIRTVQVLLAGRKKQ
jgi:hypothetical protein